MRRWFRWTPIVLISGAVWSCSKGPEHDPALEPYPRKYRPAEPPPPSRVQIEPRTTPRPPVPGEPSWYPGGGRISPRWTTIVIHHSATDRGSANVFDKSHRSRGWEELGYHFVIGNGNGSPDGSVEVGSRWYKQKHGAHCKTPDNYFNEHGVGICLVGDFTRSRPTSRQMASLKRLVTFLCSQCRIPSNRITSHGEVTRKTQCPGRNFPLQYFRRTVGLASGASDEQQLDGNLVRIEPALTAMRPLPAPVAAAQLGFPPH